MLTGFKVAFIIMPDILLSIEEISKNFKFDSMKWMKALILNFSNNQLCKEFDDNNIMI